MPRVGTGKLLDPMKAIDVVKYALLMGDPLRPGEIPSWFVALLKGNPPTFQNKLSAITSTGITKKFLDDNKIQIDHPEMKTYTRIVQRTRAVLGFELWDELHKQIWQEMGRRGLGHKQCPLTSALLLDPAILSSKAFSSKGAKTTEKDNIPMWRDGENAIKIQTAMVEVARARLFDHGTGEALFKKSLFSSGQHWTACARLNGPLSYHLAMVIQTEFGAPASWLDIATALNKAIWAGDHDAEIANISSLLPSNLDGQIPQMQARVKELFPPMKQLVHARQSEAYRLQQTQQDK